MTEDPSKKHDQQPNQSGRQTGQQSQGQTGQQKDKDKGADNTAQKRPTQGGHDIEQDEEQQDKAGQRRAS